MLQSLGEIEDGPLFRATISDLERRTGNLKQSMKKTIKSATAYAEATKAWAACHKEFMINASQIPILDPTIEEYLRSSNEIIYNLAEIFHHHVRILFIVPLTKVYDIDVKGAEARKKDFDHESAVNLIFKFFLFSRSIMPLSKNTYPSSRIRKKRKEIKRILNIIISGRLLSSNDLIIILPYCIYMVLKQKQK